MVADGKLEGVVVAVIEDDVMQLLAMRLLLESWGCEIIAGTTPEEVGGNADAVAPDVIVSDYRLPNSVSGFQAVDALRSRFGRHIPAIVQTGDTAASVASEAKKLGHALLHKPYDPARLKEALGRSLDHCASNV